MSIFNMTIADLIKKLSAYEADMEVKVISSCKAETKEHRAGYPVLTKSLATKNDGTQTKESVLISVLEALIRGTTDDIEIIDSKEDSAFYSFILFVDPGQYDGGRYDES